MRSPLKIGSRIRVCLNAQIDSRRGNLPPAVTNVVYTVAGFRKGRPVIMLGHTTVQVVESWVRQP